MEVNNNLPAWLQIPATYYKTTGKNFRLALFKHISTKQLSEPYIKIVSTILSHFQLSIIMLDDIFDKSVTRRGEAAMHLVHGPTLVTTWAIGITHHIYQISSELFKGDLAEKFNKLYNEVGIRTLKGQCLELTIKDYREIVRYKTSYYTVCFPVAIYILLKTNDLDRAMRIMEDEHLLELGYLFQTENDFLGNFEEDNTDIEMKSWTILIDIVSKKIDKFEYPESKKKAIEMFEEHDVYNEYVQLRENGLQALRKTVANMKLSKETNVTEQTKCAALAYCLEFFESYKFKSLIQPSVPVTEEQINLQKCSLAESES